MPRKGTRPSKRRAALPLKGGRESADTGDVVRLLPVILLLPVLLLAACQSAPPTAEELPPMPGRSGDFLWQGGGYTLGRADTPPPAAPLARLNPRP